jgi:hypothetical protein
MHQRVPHQLMATAIDDAIFALMLRVLLYVDHVKRYLRFSGACNIRRNASKGASSTDGDSY